MFIRNMFNKFYQQKPCVEVIDSSFNKLPDEIEITWFRDDKFIIGEIVADGNTYMTQALSAKEFVDMVNDTLFAAYEIPENCFSILKKNKKFEPTKEGFERLNNVAIKSSKMSFVKELQTV